MSKPLSLVTGMGLLLCLPACSQSFGALLYYLNVFPGPETPAEYEFGDQALLILVDDSDELLQWPSARDLLADKVRENLIEADAAVTVLTSQEVNTVRERDKDFDERSISELGEMFAVQQILWIQVRDFFAKARLEDSNSTARFIIRLKVFDPNAEVKAEMRLWPDNRAGHFVTVERSALDFQEMRVDEDIARMLVSEMADSVAKLFYAYRQED